LVDDTGYDEIFRTHAVRHHGGAEPKQRAEDALCVSDVGSHEHVEIAGGARRSVRGDCVGTNDYEVALLKA